MIKNNSAIVVLILLVIIMYGFLSVVPAYSQIPYLPNSRSSSEKSQNSNTTITANKSNNNDSIASLSTHYLPRNTYSSGSNTTSQSASSNNTKAIIINFDDSHKNQYTYAKPILDKYGFKATFFEVCNWVEAGHHNSDTTTTWPQIAALQQDGMDIEAHTMTHPNLDDLSSQADLDYEIGQSKQCLENHGFNPTVFAYHNGEGSDNPKVVNTVAKYYDLARTNTKSSALTFLHCDGNNDGQT